MLDRFRKIVIGSALLLVSFQSVYADGWGADESWMNDHPRPDHSTMIAAFDATSNVIWTDDYSNSIEEAIVACGTGYCVIKVASPYQGFLFDGFNLNRSQTKIEGINNPIIKPLENTSGNFTYISIENKSGKELKEVIISGLTLQPNNFGVNNDKGQFFGIKVTGQDIEDILITGNTLSDLSYRPNPNHILCDSSGKKCDQDGQIIYINGSGTDEASAIKKVTIENNTIEHTRTATSENITLGGNLKDWVITGNIIRDINNIGIDIRGGDWRWEVDKDSWNKNESIYAIDAARYGYIENNDIDTLTREGFEGSGIYVDGGHDVLIQNNTVKNTLSAYAVGAEECVVTKNITLRNNTSIGSPASGNSQYGSFTAGAFYTGKDENTGEDLYGVDGSFKGYVRDIYDPEGPKRAICAEQGHNGKGYVENITVVGNSFDSQHGYADITPTYPVANGTIFSVRLTHALIQDGIGFPEVNTGNNGNAPANSNANAIKHPQTQTATFEVNNDIASVTEGEQVIIDVLANDTGSGLTMIAVDDVWTGNISIINNKLTYNASGSFIGTLDTWYGAQDSNGDVKWAKVTITINSQNTTTGPIAEDDWADVMVGETVNIDVLANDSGSNISIAGVDDVWTGSVEIINNKLVYHADSPADTNIDLWYSIVDSNGSTAWAKVDLSIYN